jgi:acylphosphatase/Zn finger protein HypA/HybF involved in hydrogenase expression
MRTSNYVQKELPMHEFNVTERLFQVALTQADLHDGERIRRLHINLDPDSGYAPEAIRFYFEQLAQNTPAEGAELAFELRPQPEHIVLHQLEIEAVSAEKLEDFDGKLKFPSIPTNSDESPFIDPTKAIIRWRLQMFGEVQSIVFRLFLYNLAHQLGLNGWVRTTPSGVELELQGPAGELDHFLYHLRHDAPSLAQIGEFEISTVPPLIEKPSPAKAVPRK